MDKSIEVLNLHCSECSRILCRRGQAVRLVAEPNTHLFSTDYVTDFVEEISPEPYKISTCNCMIKDLACKFCKKKTGYHVHTACTYCIGSENNGHYWLFSAEGVRPEPQFSKNGQKVLWSTLHLFEKDTIVLKNQENDKFLCPICYELLEVATILKCGHTFFRVCIVREIDVRKHCPLCRTQVNHTQAFPNLLVRDLVNNLEIHCKYGCKKEGNCWAVDGNGCLEIILYKDRAAHEQICNFEEKKKLNS